MSEKKIGLPGAIALVLGNMVGPAIFSNLGIQANLIPSASVLMIVWIFGGLLALCGGISYVKLARIYPGGGGEFHYIRKIYPRAISYTAGIVSIVAGFAAPVALSAKALGVYTARLFPGWDSDTIGICSVTAVALLHGWKWHIGSWFQMVTTFLKIITLIVFIGFGLQSGYHEPFTLTAPELSLLLTENFATGLIYVSFAYSGWNACVYIFAEMKHPQRNIPYSIYIGTGLVVSLYLLLNYVFLKTVALHDLKGSLETGALSANAIFGPTGEQITAVVICFLLLSSISAMTFLGPRVIRHIFLSKYADTAPRFIPHYLTSFIQFLIVVVFLITGSYEQIIRYSAIFLCASSFLAVTNLFVGRKVKLKESIAPGIFLIANLYCILLALAAG